MTTTKTLIGHLLPVALAAVAIAGCGSASQPRSNGGVTGQDKDTAQLAFSGCMRSNGVPNFPDLSGHGIGIEASGQTLTVNGVAVNAPAFAAARAKCERYLPHVHAGPAQIAQQTRKGLEFARCMRSHGVPNFPDPKVTPGTNGNAVADLRGSGLNFQTPAFQAAASACGGGPKGPF